MYSQKLGIHNLLYVQVYIQHFDFTVFAYICLKLIYIILCLHLIVVIHCMPVSIVFMNSVIVVYMIQNDTVHIVVGSLYYAKLSKVIQMIEILFSGVMR